MVNEEKDEVRKRRIEDKDEEEELRDYVRTYAEERKPDTRGKAFKVECKRARTPRGPRTGCSK